MDIQVSELEKLHELGEIREGLNSYKSETASPVMILLDREALPDARQTYYLHYLNIHPMPDSRSFTFRWTSLASRSPLMVILIVTLVLLLTG